LYLANHSDALSLPNHSDAPTAPKSYLAAT